jgi:hypothetical protein
MSASAIKKVKFAQAVFAGKTQKQAALWAGYKAGPGLEALASKLMKDAIVDAELARLRQAGADKAVADQAEVERLLTEQIRGDVSDFVTIEKYVHKDLNGKPTGEVSWVPKIDIKKASKQGKLHLLAGFEITEKGAVKFKMADVQGAIDRLARMKGWYKAEKHEVTHSVAPAEKLSDAELLAEAKRYGIKVEGGQ